MRGWNVRWLAACVTVLCWSACTTGSVEEDTGDGGLRGTGATCLTDDECRGGRCEGGRCVTAPPPCTMDSQCPGAQCVDGTCRPRQTCAQNSECPTGQRCTAGACVPGCVTHQDCTADQHCENNVCNSGGLCTADADCPAGNICSTAGWCTPGCRNTDGCLNGQVCENSACVDCSSSAQCQGGRVCMAGRCTVGCAGNQDCMDGQVCRAGSCGACATTTECGAGFVCQAGACEALPPCANDAACPATSSCQGGFCVPNPGCTSTAECASPNVSCVFGTCTRNPTCTTTADCSSLQTCTGGQCVNNPTCQDQSACASNQACVGGVCTNNGGCASDAECPAAQSCVSNTCTNNNACTQDSQCPTSQACVGGVCTRNPSCTRELDCAPTQACVGGQCTRNSDCTSDAQCTNIQACVNGTCTRNPSCGQDGDCAATQSCISGVCAHNGMCSSHGDCPATQYCLGNTCVQGPQCSSDLQCSNNQRCVSGRCEDNPSCQSNLDCPREQRCESNLCVRNPSCDSHNPCPMGLACWMGGCVQVRNCARNEDCQDNSLCNGQETCDLANGGTCVAGQPILKDDFISCTDDVCDPLTGQVTHLPRNALCNDQNVCTLDVCDAALDCQHMADPAATPAQTLVGDCQAQVCVGTMVSTVVNNQDVPRDDGLSCTVEACNNGSPQVTANHAACNDQNLCNGTEQCVTGQGCRPAATGLSCPDPDACHVGFCTPATGCGSRLLDLDGDGYASLGCGGLDCDDRNANVNPGRAEVPGDGLDNNCNGDTDEGAATLSCPAAPVGRRILDPITLTATVAGGVAGSYSVRWTVTAEPQANSLALQGANTVSVSFVPVVRGAYTLRARLTQVGAADQTCDVSFTVDGPDEDFNAQLVMRDGVDVDLHVLHPEGLALEDDVDFINSPSLNAFYYSFNWGPFYNFALYDGVSPYVSNFAEERIRVMPDCHFNNCTACTVTVPGQPGCTSTSLAWNADYRHPSAPASVLYPFVNGATGVSVDANPKLDIDNRRGCYTDALGNRVCTPENISIRRPSSRAGNYTVAVHYWGSPVVQNGASFEGNERGTAPAGLTRVTVDVEVYCKGVGFKRYRCSNLPVDGWCFVADAAWNGTQCASVTTASGATAAGNRTFPYALMDGLGSNIPPQWDTSTSFLNVWATPLP